MAIYKASNIVAKNGLNYVCSVVESSGSLFNKIEWENDLGIDATVEFIRDGKSLNRHVAVQIKSGMSYYSQSSNECSIPIGDHRDYWLNHPLPVIGAVFVPIQNVAYWIDIKRYLKTHSQLSTIRFIGSEINRFDNSSFKQFIITKFLNEPPELSYPEAIRHFKASDYEQSELGLKALFHRYPNNLGTWNEIIKTIKEKPWTEISPRMIYILAHIPGHPDIFYVGESVTGETRSYVKELMKTLCTADIIKLLYFIEEDVGIGRGTLGQSVEAIISSLPNNDHCLIEIINNNHLEMVIREHAAFILAMNKGKSIIPLFSPLINEGSILIQQIEKYLRCYGKLNPYQ